MEQKTVEEYRLLSSDDPIRLSKTVTDVIAAEGFELYGSPAISTTDMGGQVAKTIYSQAVIRDKKPTPPAPITHYAVIGGRDRNSRSY